MKASDVKTGLAETQPNPSRRCKKYCSTTVRPYAPGQSGRKMTSLGKPFKAKPIKDASNLKTGHAKSSKLTELRKEAKALGIEKVNTIPEDRLAELIAETKGSDVEKLTPPPAPPASDVEIDALRKEIKDRGGNLPRGKKSREPEALKKVLDKL